MSDNSNIPYDVIDLPSDGILYPSKTKTIKVEYLTALDESILTSPNLGEKGLILDTLLERKIKNLNFDPLDLLIGDRLAILIWLRITGYGHEYPIQVWNEKEKKYEIVQFDLRELKQKKLTVVPDENGLFDFITPISQKKLKFKLLTGNDDKEITRKDAEWISRGNDSLKVRFRLEQQIVSIDDNNDPVHIFGEISKMPLKDSIDFKKYASDIDPGIDFKINVKTSGGESVETFLTIRSDFFLL